MTNTLYYNNFNLRAYEENFNKILSFPKKISEYFKKREKINNVTPEIEILNYFYKEATVSIMLTTNNIAELLEKNHVIIDEYYDFIEIQRIIINILEKNTIQSLEEKELNIIINMVKELEKITDFKFKLLEKIDFEISSFEELPKDLKEEFIHEYRIFYDKIFEYEQEYYSNLTPPKDIKNVKKLFKIMSTDLIKE